MAIATHLEYRIRIEQLPALYRQLGIALIQAGLPTAQIQERLETDIQLDCWECGIPISGKELALAALTDPSSDFESGKVNRLSLGYCARRGCQSYYVEIVVRPSEGVDWSSVWNSAEQALSARTEPELRKGNKCWWVEILMVLGIRRMGLTVAAGIVLTLFVWYLRTPPAYSRYSPEYGGAEVFGGVPQ